MTRHRDSMVLVVGIVLFSVGMQARTAEGAGAGAQWVYDLPTAAAVSAAIHGSSPQDTAARQAAALNVLFNYTLDHAPSLPPAERRIAEQRGHEYSAAEPPWTSPADAYAQDDAFKAQILARWLHLTTAQRPPQHQAMAEAAPEQTPEGQRQRQAIAGDLSSAHDHHVDLTVFGVRLGEAWQLPPCPENFRRPLRDTCRDETRAGAMTQLAPGMVQALLKNRSGGAPWMPTGVPVRLADSKCPSWIRISDCTVMFNVENGILMGAMFQTNDSDSQDKILGALTGKYGSAAHKMGRTTSCQNNLTGMTTERAREHTWVLPGLRVSYSPIKACSVNGMQGYGGVIVELQSLRQKRDDTARRVETSEPKM